MSSKRALLLVDLQYDFLPGGALAVKEGDQVIAIANQLLSKFDLVVASQDWHPREHFSFASNHPGKKVGEFVRVGEVDQILWPDHCVQNSHGARLVKELETETIDRIFPKGTNPQIDSYSAFFDNLHLQSTGLGDYLKQERVNEIFVMGLATDYCVLFTVIDGLKLGFKMFVVKDGCRAVNLRPNDGERALGAMQAEGATLLNSTEIS